MIDTERALRAFEDVLAVEYDEDTDMARVVTMSDCYDVDMRETRHVCPDREYNLDGTGICKHLAASEIVRGQLDVPGGWLVVENLDERTDDPFQITDRFPDFDEYMTNDRLMTDGAGAQMPEGHDQFTLWNAERENARHFDTKSEAEAKQDELSGLMDVEMFPPGESPEGVDASDDAETDGGDTAGPVEDCDVCGDEVPIREAEAGDGGKPIHPDCAYPDDSADEATPDDVAESVQQATDAPNTEVVDHSPEEPADAPDPTPEPDAAHDPEVLSPDEVERYAADLEDRDVGTDPLKWMPGEFVDEIDGTQAINRKGFEVLRFFYGIDLDMEMEVDPNDNEMTHCRFKAVATTPDGDTFEAWGTSHLDRGDDSWLLVEMAATRARKRALSIATGAGAVAVEELQNEVQ